MAGMNANALLIGRQKSPSYHQAIGLPDDIRRRLIAASREIRQHLKEAAQMRVASGSTMELATNKYRQARQ